MVVRRERPVVVGSEVWVGVVVRRRGSQIFIGHQRGACTVFTVCQCVSLVWASGRSAAGRERHLLWLGAGSGWGRLRVGA